MEPAVERAVRAVDELRKSLGLPSDAFIAIGRLGGDAFIVVCRPARNILDLDCHAAVNADYVRLS